MRRGWPAPRPSRTRPRPPCARSAHPRGDPSNPRRGVFSTRSPDRPNPIGLHRVTIVAVDGRRIRVHDLEAIDGTPIVDVKPILDPCER
ncbi:MAG: SAM-dependent methyltransferase [Actinobacteria bacterium]|nr:MAG: SAM-dependent methyltransferase [Actinomycetota bacterium]